MKIDKRSKIDQLTFRLNLARQLISGYTSRKRRFKSVNFLSNQREIPKEVKLTNVGKYLPNKQSNYRKCRLCSTKKTKKEQNTLAHSVMFRYVHILALLNFMANK